MLAESLVFSVEGERYYWRDVILSALRHGEWQAADARARRGAASVRAADELGRSLPPGALDVAGRDFRYAHDLVTAQSMEEWLTRHDLTVQDWTGYLRRELHRTRAGAGADALVSRYPLAAQDAARITLIDAICAGDLDRWARTLAERAAAHASVVDGSVAVTPPAPDGGDAGAILIPPALRPLLGGDDDALRHSLRRLARIDDSLGAFRGALVTERAVSDYLNARQLDWVRFGCRLMTFPDEGQAAEAALLLREDGEGFTTVYQVAHTAPRGAQFFLDQVDASMKDHFLGSRPGDLIGPVHVDDQYVLYQVEEKVLPSLHDDDVRRRAERGVLDTALGLQANQRVVWQEAL